MPAPIEVMIAGQLYTAPAPALAVRLELSAHLASASGAAVISAACAVLGAALAPDVPLTRGDLWAYGDAVFEQWLQRAERPPASVASALVAEGLRVACAWDAEVAKLFLAAEELAGNSEAAEPAAAE